MIYSITFYSFYYPSLSFCFEYQSVTCVVILEGTLVDCVVGDEAGSHFSTSYSICLVAKNPSFDRVLTKTVEEDRQCDLLFLSPHGVMLFVFECTIIKCN